LIASLTPNPLHCYATRKEEDNKIEYENKPMQQTFELNVPVTATEHASAVAAELRPPN